MSVQQIRQYFMSQWQTVALYGGLFAVLAFALVWKLNNLVPGYSQPEVETYHDSLSISNILDNPLNAPFLLVVKALLYVHPDSYLATRVAAVLFGLAVLVIFAWILKTWHDTRTSIIGTLLFGLSAWFLHTSRLGTPDVMLFGVFVLAACGYWLKRSNSWLALAACFTLAAGLMYMPGMVWFVGLAGIWQWRVLDRIFKKHLIAVSLAGLAFLAALFPLGWALFKDHSLIKPWLGLPHDWATPVDMVKNIVEAPFHLFVRQAEDPITWLGTAPILDVFCLVMFVLGSYLYLRHVRLARTPIFISLLLLTLGLMALGSTVTYTVVMPIIYLVVAAGVAHLLNLWFGVFPRNPIPRVIGWSLVSVVLAIVCAFHLTHYFVGWPQAAATHEVFTSQKP